MSYIIVIVIYGVIRGNDFNNASLRDILFYWSFALFMFYALPTFTYYFSSQMFLL